MSEYTTVRGKLVALGRVHLAVHNDGQLQFRIGEYSTTISEADASAFYNLLGDVLEWQSNKGLTEAQLERSAEQDEADMESGKVSVP